MRCGCGYGCVDMVVPNAQWQSMESSTRASVVINCECTHMSVLTHTENHTLMSPPALAFYLLPTPLSPSLSLSATRTTFSNFPKKKIKTIK